MQRVKAGIRSVGWPILLGLITLVASGGCANRGMMMMADTSNFESTIPFTEKIPAGVLYCSDGRFGDQSDQFLHEGLDIPQYDRVILPGGPGCLIGHDAAHVQAEGVLDDLEFLIEAHELERVVLIAHEGCAFYTELLGVSGAELEQKQREDLRAAAERIRERVTDLTIEAYFARRTPDGKIAFEPVPIEQAAPDAPISSR